MIHTEGRRDGDCLKLGAQMIYEKLKIGWTKFAIYLVKVLKMVAQMGAFPH